MQYLQRHSNSSSSRGVWPMTSSSRGFLVCAAETDTSTWPEQCLS